MFSVQTHNQVLYHLTQLASAVTSKCTSCPTKAEKQDESVKETQEEVSDRSVSEASNYFDIPIGKINMHDIGTTFRAEKNNVQIILEQLSKEPHMLHLEKYNKWKLSYVSGLSFMENKRTRPCSHLTETLLAPIIRLSVKQQHRTLCTLRIKNPLVSHAQVRNFKTERGVRAEIERRPSLLMWFRSLFDHLGTKAQKGNLEIDSEKLKSFVSTMKATPEEQKKLLLAFTTGYDLGGQRPKRFRSTSSIVAVCITALCALYFAYHLGSLESLSLSYYREFHSELVTVKFDDCKGVEPAKNELKDIVAFLKNPEKFISLGGKLPKGVLLVGPPGTGKTLLARAVAGEAGVPFFCASGSEFDDLFVGQGARRLRSLFRAAKEKAPAVIFIDEIDSVGRKRTSSVVQPYANQTINQLLSEMDGFVQNEGVIVLGATNKASILDDALKRPGRFDVQVYVDKPDFTGRMEIFNLYLSRVMSRDIDVENLARRTIGFSGADIENMVNQAALKAACSNADYVTMEHLDYAQDKVTIGAERKSRKDDKEGIRLTAYHEAGHALVAYYTKDAMPIHKISIIPRGHTLGHVSYIPESELHQTKAQMLASIDSAMGGRVAEELVFGPDKVTAGACSDLEHSTKIAENMVKRFGMSEKVGLRVEYDQENNPIYSSQTKELIDSEIKRILQESFERAKSILTTHAKEHKLLAETLLKYETLTADEMKTLLNGKSVQPTTTNSMPSLRDSTKNVL